MVTGFGDISFMASRELNGIYTALALWGATETSKARAHWTLQGQAAVDHDGLVPHRSQGPHTGNAAPVEFHAAADAVRSAAQDDDARLLGRQVCPGAARRRRPPSCSAQSEVTEKKTCQHAVQRERECTKKVIGCHQAWSKSVSLCTLH